MKFKYKLTKRHPNIVNETEFEKTQKTDKPMPYNNYKDYFYDQVDQIFSFDDDEEVYRFNKYGTYAQNAFKQFNITINDFRKTFPTLYLKHNAKTNTDFYYFIADKTNYNNHLLQSLKN